jgi:hypothetical protein
VHGVNHVLASLQPGTSPRQIFVTQPTLYRLDAAARVASNATDDMSAGLLLGSTCQCPQTKVKYLVIDSVAASGAKPRDTRSMASALEELLTARRRRRENVLGWYCIRRRGDENLDPDEEALHRSYFDQPWQSTLLLAAQSPGDVRGVFFQHGALSAPAFRAPFYEVLDSKAHDSGAKPTCIAWPTYLTGDTVVVVPSVQPAAESSERSRSLPVSNTHRSAWGVIRSALGGVGAAAAAKRKPGPSRAPGTNDDRASRAAELRKTRTTQAQPGLPRPPARPADTERAPGPRNGRRAAAPDDATTSGHPGRYLELAREDGFYLTAKFDAAPGCPEAQTLWVLQDPFYGLLLVVATSATAVLDASLHYNLSSDDPEALRSAFSEHRDLESKTLYMKESCIERLRARCEVLRASGALVPEWRVSPTIFLLTPGEWDGLTGPDSAGSARAIRDLNHERILALPDAVRRRFGLGVHPELVAQRLPPAPP